MNTGTDGENQIPKEEEGTLENRQDQRTYSEEEYKNIQSFATKAQQELISARIDIARDNPKTILDMDIKMQNKVIKDIYGLDNIEELKTIHGDNFYDNRSEEEKELSEVEQLKKKVQLIEFNSKKGKLNSEIDIYIEKNKDLFDIPENEILLREKLKYISESLPEKERIQMASSIAFGNNNPSSSAYKDISVISGTIGANTVSSDNKENTDGLIDFAKERGYIK